jgi:nucleoid-associated protein YgaU
VIEEGDTLYKIAIKFYGRTSAWKQIRDANKALITTDGRVKSGDEIKLP